MCRRRASCWKDERPSAGRTLARPSRKSTWGRLALPLSEEGHLTGPRLGGDLVTRGREEASHIPGHGRRNRGPPACRPPCRRCGSPLKPQKPAQGFGVRGRDCVGARGRHLRGEDGVMLRGPSQLTCGGRLFWLVQLSRFCRINGFKILSSGLGLSSVAFRKCVSIRECGQIPPGRERPLTPGEACEGPSTDAWWVPVPAGGGDRARPSRLQRHLRPREGAAEGAAPRGARPPKPRAVASGSGEAATCVDTPLGSCRGVNRVPQAQVPK